MIWVGKGRAIKKKNFFEARKNVTPKLEGGGDLSDLATKK